GIGYTDARRHGRWGDAAAPALRQPARRAVDEDALRATADRPWTVPSRAPRSAARLRYARTHLRLAGRDDRQSGPPGGADRRAARELPAAPGWPIEGWRNRPRHSAGDLSHFTHYISVRGRW